MRNNVKLCYVDESGTGGESIATMVGVVVDAQRMHLMKRHSTGLIEALGEMAGRDIPELHTRDFCSGNGAFRGIDGNQRAAIISRILEWVGERGHRVVYASVMKDHYFAARAAQRVPTELNTLWRFLGFCLILAMQKLCRRARGTKGHTILVLDNQEWERMRLTDLILNPPTWSDEYYRRKKGEEQLDQVVDIPYFGDPREVSLDPACRCARVLPPTVRGDEGAAGACQIQR